MIFVAVVVLIVVLIIVFNTASSSKVEERAVGWLLPFICIGVLVLVIFSATGDDPSSSEKGLVQESVTKVVSVTHTVGDQKYLVELDKGSYKTVEEYDLTYQEPVIKNSSDKVMEEVFVKMPAMNWVYPWEYHRAHEDIIHFPANEIKVVP